MLRWTDLVQERASHGNQRYYLRCRSTCLVYGGLLPRAANQMAGNIFNSVVTANFVRMESLQTLHRLCSLIGCDVVHREGKAMRPGQPVVLSVLSCTKLRSFMSLGVPAVRSSERGGAAARRVRASSPDACCSTELQSQNQECHIGCNAQAS